MMTNKQTLTISVLLFLLTILNFISVHAQVDEDFFIRLTKEFGYSSGSGKMQGTFTLGVSKANDLVQVIFYIDGEQLGVATKPPFQLSFRTDDYKLGEHTLHADGYYPDGRVQRSDDVLVEFVSAEEGMKAGLRILFIILGLILGATLISLMFTMLLGGKRKRLKPGESRSYGLFGGTICPNCDRPFALHIFGLNLIVGKYDRCPYCGKWNIGHRKPDIELHQAEEAELRCVNGAVLENYDLEKRLHKDLDDSRYVDL